MKRKTILIPIILMLMLQPAGASADIVPLDRKPVDSTFKISNLGDYPDYLFLLHGKPLPTYELIKAGEPFSIYKLGAASIYAIKKSDFDELELSENTPPESEKFFQDNPKLISSDLKLKSHPTVAKDDPLEKAVTYLRIDSLKENEFKIVKTKVVYTYEDGASEEKTFKSDDTIPEPSKKQSKESGLPGWFRSFWFIVLPVAALIGIIFILVIGILLARLRQKRD